MHDQPLYAALHDVVDELLDRPFRNELARCSPPFELEKPNQHDSKSEFMQEKRIVENGIEHVDALIAQLTTDDTERKSVLSNLRSRIDAHAAKKTRNGPPCQPVELVVKNMADVGFSLASILSLFELKDCFQARKQELDDQELEFWSISHRAPNYHARTIALRLARLYAQKMKCKPTVGTSRDGGHPSTRFGRAVEKCFAILSIDADFRNPTEWAVSQITEKDFEDEPKIVLGGLFSDIPTSPADKGFAGFFDKAPDE